jgi:hypothetical protein
LSGTWLCGRAAATTATSTPSPCQVGQAEGVFFQATLCCTAAIPSVLSQF